MTKDISEFTKKVNTTYPDLKITSARRFSDSGQFNEVLLVNESLIFRFPRSAHVAQEFHREVKVLRALQGRLALPIPDSHYTALDPDTGDYIFMGYPMLPGEPLLRELFSAINDDVIYQQIAVDLGAFLSSLHTIPIDSLGLELEGAGTRESWVNWFAEFEEKLFPYMRADAKEKITADFDTALNDPVLWDFALKLCHGDFGTGNILYQEGHISGIIDFGSCSERVTPNKSRDKIWRNGFEIDAKLMDRHIPR